MSLRIVGVEAHLDPYFAWLPPERARERRKDFIRAFEEAVNFALREKVDLFLLPGDVFDKVNPRNAVMARFAWDLRRLREAGTKVFAVPGHHDRPRHAREPSPLRVFHEAGLLTLFDRLDEVEGVTLNLGGYRAWVGGLGFDHFLNPGQDPLAGASISRPEDADLTILMTHYTIQGFQAYPAGEPVISLESIPEWVDLVVAGHLHQHAVRTVRDTVICYVGTAERLSFAEEDQEKGFTIIEVEGGRVRVEQIPTHARPMKTLRVTIPERGDLTQLILRELSELSKSLSGEALVRVKLVGAMTMEVLSTYRRSEMVREGNKMFFGVNVDDGDVEYVGAFEAPHVELETPLKELEKVYRKMLSTASDEEERDLLEEAYQRAREALEEAGGW